MTLQSTSSWNRRSPVGAAAVFFAVLLLTVGGCGNDPSAPDPAPIVPPGTHDLAELPIGGGDIPEQVVEGDNAFISVWGTIPDPRWVLERLEAKVLATPEGDQPGRIEITALGRIREEGDPVPPDDPTGPPNADGSVDSISSSAAFAETVSLPPLQPGAYTVVLHAPGGDQQFSLRVVGDESLVRYAVHDASGRNETKLILRRDGTAIASRGMEGMRAETRISPESLRVIVGWFRDTGFAELENEYLGGTGGPIHEISLNLEETRKRVLAEPDLMPPQLRRLVGRLDDLLRQILGSIPEPSAVWGTIEVEPVQADPGTARLLRLTLVNDGASPVTLNFRTEQVFDFQIFEMRMPMGLPGHPEDPGVPGHPGFPGDPDFPGHPGDPGYPGDPGHPGHPGIPGDSTCPGDPPPPPGGDLDDPSPPVPPDSIPGPPREPIWNWADGKAFPQVLSTLTLDPGERRVFEETWNGLSNSGETVGQGGFMVVAPVLSDVPVPVRPARLIVGDDDMPPPPPPPPPGAPLAAALACEPLEGAPGTPRTFTLSVTNLSREPFSLRFLTAQRYDFAVFDSMHMGPDGNMGPGPIWAWSVAREFPEIAGLETWAPGETKTFVETWDGVDQEGSPAGPGLYVVSGFLSRRPMEDRNLVRFVITPE